MTEYVYEITYNVNTVNDLNSPIPHSAFVYSSQPLFDPETGQLLSGVDPATVQVLGVTAGPSDSALVTSPIGLILNQSGSLQEVLGVNSSYPYASGSETVQMVTSGANAESAWVQINQTAALMAGDTSTFPSGTTFSSMATNVNENATAYYGTFSQNCNTFVNTVLNEMGINQPPLNPWTDVLTSDIGNDDAPGGQNLIGNPGGGTYTVGSEQSTVFVDVGGNNTLNVDEGGTLTVSTSSNNYLSETGQDFGGTDTINLQGSTNASNVTFERFGNNLYIEDSNGNTAAILDDYFSPDNPRTYALSFNGTGSTIPLGDQQSMISQFPYLASEMQGLGHWMSSKMESAWGGAMATGSPLVLDLSSGGTGLTLSPESGSGAVLWDFGDGFLHQSGFVSGTTGLLCIDPTGTGVITQADLFGNEAPTGAQNGVQAANGFQALADFANMTSGILDASNPVFSELRVWVPSVNDGAVTTPGAGELYTLAQLGITSINLGYAAEDYQINGNWILQQSTFTINDSNQTIADAWFSYDPLNTIYDQSYTLNPEVLQLPELRGYGDLPNLSVAMSQDSTLLNDVANLAGQSFSQLLDPTNINLESAIKGILYEWAGVENVDPGSRGGFFDAQKLGFLEQFMGQPLWDVAGSEPWAGVVPHLVESWDIALSYLSAHLLAQTAFSYVTGTAPYDAATDSFVGSNSLNDMAVQFADENYNGAGLQHMATNDIFVLEPGDAPLSIYNTTSLLINETPNGGGTNLLVLAGATEANTIMWTDYLGNLYVKYTSTDVVEITDGQTSAAAPSVVGQYVQDIVFADGGVWNLTGGLDLTANSVAPTIYGTAAGGDILDASGISNATVWASTGIETIIAGPASTLHGGTGTNYYVINPGDAPASSGGAIIDPNVHATNDQIVLHGVTPGQAYMYDDYSGNLIIATANGDLAVVQGGTYDYYNGNTIGNVAAVDFDNGTVWSLTSDVTLTAANFGQTLYGLTSGTNFVAGAGDNNFYGHNANDVFNFTSGSSPASYGGDTIIEYVHGGNATIAFHGIAPSAVTMYDNSSGNVMFSFGTDLVTVQDGSYNAGTNGLNFTEIQHVTFDNGTTWNTTGGLDLTAAAAGQVIYGTENGGDTLTAASTYDYLYAFGGNDTLIGAADATLYNGTGNDTDVFTAGFGSATVNANASGGTDNVIMFHDVSASALSISDNTSGQLVVNDGSGDQLTIGGGAFNWSTGFTVPNIDHFSFDDGSTLGLGSGLDLTAGTSGQVLYGGAGVTMTADATYVTFYAFAGNETIVGGSSSTIYNGSGNDTDVFTSGFGYAGINADASGGSSNSIVLHDVAASGLFLADNTNGQLIISDSVGDALTLFNGSYSSSTGFSVGNVQQIDLDGGTTISLTGGLNLAATGNGQALYGTGHGDQMAALGSGDYLMGIAGNNTMTSAANTITYMYGGSGNDTFVDGGGTANNQITAGTGADQYVIESPNSSTTISGFSIDKGDVINVENVISAYDPVADALGNFVQETTVGSSTQISLDPTGQGHFSAVSVVLSGVTGLPDVATLVAEGALRVHG